MKSLYLRSGLALLCAVILSACGGGNGSLALSGTVSNLTKDGLVLVNTNTGEKLPIPNGTSTFVFTKLAAVDEQFNVIVDAQPTGANCQPSGTTNTGKANVYTAYYIAFICTTNPLTLGGTVTGLDTKGLVLANGADTVAVLPGASASTPVTFTFPTKVGDGSPFGVTVLSQPKDTTKTCTLANNVGTMPSGVPKDQLSIPYMPIVVTCQ
jgi:hypothetical protein